LEVKVEAAPPPQPLSNLKLFRSDPGENSRSKGDRRKKRIRAEIAKKPVEKGDLRAGEQPPTSQQEGRRKKKPRRTQVSAEVKAEGKEILPGPAEAAPPGHRKRGEGARRSQKGSGNAEPMEAL